MGRFLDGGLLANNPTLDAMAEVHQYNKAVKAEVCNLAVTGLTFQLSSQSLLLAQGSPSLSFIVLCQGRGKSKKLGMVVSLGTGKVPLSVQCLFWGGNSPLLTHL